MSWLTNYVRPKIHKLVTPVHEIPDNFWTKCPKCEGMIFHKELEQNMHLCPKCGYHFRLGSKERLESLFDAGNFTEISLPEVTENPLNFTDIKKYSDRLKTYRKQNGTQDAIRVAHGTISGMPAVVGILDFSFMGGSMGMAVGEAIVAAAELAILQEASLILVTASGGARMQEGMLSLVQMARTTIAINKLKEHNRPYIVVMTDPTTGGVTASFASLGDIIIAEQGATIGFAGARVVEQTIRETLPTGFQTAEYLLKHGMLDIVVKRTELRDTLATVIGFLTAPKPAAPVIKVSEIIPENPKA